MNIELAPETLFQVGFLPITNTLLTTWITMVVIVGVAYAATRKISLVPDKPQAILEIVLDWIFDLGVGLSDHIRAKKFFSIVATFFIFIIFANYLGLFPGVGTIGFYTFHGQEEVWVPLIRPMNTDLNATLALALISVAMTHYYAISILGFGAYLGKFFSLNPVFLFVGFLEIIAEFTKLVSLSFRLFGNIFAGEALLVTISSLFAFILPLPFIALELLVGFVQAMIFMMLTLVFMIILSEKATH
ncbi:F0F1 ATP synthase subunit A [Patescibacteria group bacterium]|nr:F0F1 ATP synthase subunit A [Patescibacteria group bacterium]